MKIHSVFSAFYLTFFACCFAFGDETPIGPGGNGGNGNNPDPLNCFTEKKVACPTPSTFRCSDYLLDPNIIWIDILDENGDKIGERPAFDTPKYEDCPSDVWDEIPESMSDETECGSQAGSDQGGKVIPDGTVGQAIKTCYFERPCGRTAFETNSLRDTLKARDLLGNEMDGYDLEVYWAYCQPGYPNPVTDRPVELEWSKCVPYDNCKEQSEITVDP